MNPAERALRRVDAFQQSHPPLAFAMGVIKKFGDDNAGGLVANLTYSGFVTVFPLLLLAITILGLVLAGHPGLDASVRDSILTQFPVIGPQLLDHIHGLRSHATVGFVVGLFGLLWGSLGLSQAGIFAMEQIWNIPGPDRANYVTRLARSFGFLATLGVGVIAASVLSALGTYGHHALWVPALEEGLSLLISVGQFWLAFRVLTPKVIASRRLLPGAALGGVVWTAIQGLAGYLVAHDLRHDSALYGTFAVVLGLIAYIYLGARVAVYSAEMNVVLQDHLWPRGLIQPPLTPADQESLARQALQNQRRPEQRVQVSFTEPARLGSAPDLPGSAGTGPEPVAMVRGASEAPLEQ
ncbi:MAG: YihY/virulence factor BrkB family protein [Mycobacteriales bacterium]